MGKKNDLWDDSALINAFDDAISKYKKMHGIEQHDSSKEGGKAMGSTKAGLSTSDHGNQEDKRHTEAYDNSNAASSTSEELGETNNLLQNEKNQIVDSSTEEPNVDSSHGQKAQDALQEYSDTQGAGDYNQLLNQYYELEEQRQKILQQLQQFGSGDYQSYGSGLPWNTCYVSQEHPVSTTQTSYPALVSSCCPYVGQCLVAPCSLGGSCVQQTPEPTSGKGHTGKSQSTEDGDIVKTAMGAAERALSSLMTKEKGVEMQEGQLEQSATCETDLTVVFNAWYSAGFYTGKYLAEQSMVKKHHG